MGVNHEGGVHLNQQCRMAILSLAVASSRWKHPAMDRLSTTFGLHAGETGERVEGLEIGVYDGASPSRGTFDGQRPKVMRGLAAQALTPATAHI